MPLEQDEWATLHQVLPRNVYDRLKVQLRRVALANGIAVEAWDADDKFAQNATGARVLTIESLVILMERSENETLRV